MKRMVTLAIAIVVLITVTSVWAYRRHRVDPQVQQIVQAQKRPSTTSLRTNSAGRCSTSSGARCGISPIASDGRHSARCGPFSNAAQRADGRLLPDDKRSEDGLS